jgi:hypothetical protein
MFDYCGGTPRPGDYRANRPMARLWVPGLDNFAYLAPHLNETSGELLPREIDVLLQGKK